jgi:hypothetical protein
LGQAYQQALLILGQALAARGQHRMATADTFFL